MYQLRGRSGRWGFGEIYEAVHKETGDIRLLKLVRGRRARDPHIRAHLRRELEVAQRVDHPNILKIEEIQEDPGLGVFLVMKPISGETLTAVLERGVTFVASKAVQIFRGVAEGLVAAHALNMVHGELGPDAIFLQGGVDGSSPTPLITGFGLPPGDSESQGAGTSLPLEAMPYASPERRQGKSWEDRSDIYALSAILAQLLTGQAPPPQGWRSPPELPPEAPKESRDFLELAARGMHGNPEERYPNMEAMVSAAGFLMDSWSAPLAPAAPPAKVLPRSRKRRVHKTSMGMGSEAARGNTAPTNEKRRNKVKRQTPPPPLPTGARKPKGAPKKTVLGMAAVRPETKENSSDARAGGGVPRPADPSKSLKVTHPGVAAVPPKRPAPPSPQKPVSPLSASSLSGRSDPSVAKTSSPGASPPGVAPPPEGGGPSDAEQIDMVTTEAAKDDVGLQPLEPEVFGGQTGALPEVDPEDIKSEVRPMGDVGRKKKQGKKKWILLVMVMVVVLGGVAVAAVLLEPWKWISLEDEGKQKNSKEEMAREGGGGDAGKETRKVKGDVTVAARPSFGDAGGGDAGVSDAGVSGDGAMAPDAGGVNDAGQRDAGGDDEVDAASDEKEIASDMGRYRLYLKQGRRAMRHGRYKLARRQFTRALKIRKRSFRARRYMGEAHYRAKEYWAAVHWFKRTLKVSPRSGSTHLYLGRAYIKVKKQKLGCKHLLRAFKIRPNSKTYRRYVENYRCR